MGKKKIFGILVGAIVLVFAVTAIIMAASGATNKTALFSQVQPGGVFVITDQTDGVGNIWFVDYNSGTSSNSTGCGRNPDSPCGTIDYAIGLATANNGDRIYVAPGHTQNISTASQIDIDVAGIRIIGQGIGRNRPILTWTAAAGYIEVNAANTSLENMIFDLSTVGIAVTGISVFTNATDFKFLDNEVILYQEASGSATHGINIWSGGTRTQIANSRFIGDLSSASGVTDAIAISIAAVDDIEIKNTFISAYSSSALINVTTAVSGFYLHDSTIYQGSAASTNLCFTATSSKGIVRDVITATSSGATNTAAALSSADAL